MRHIHFTVTPPSEEMSPVIELIVMTEWVEEAQLLDWNLTGASPAMLYLVTADRERFETALEGCPEVLAFEIAPLDADRFAFLTRLERIGSFARVLEALTTDGLIVLKPIVYRDGVVHGNWVGQPEQIRAGLENLPPASVTVEGISDFDVRREAPTAALTDRQFEAVRVASDMGYYESPREATHAEIAAVLGCSPSTATVHLQKAEAKLVIGVLASSPDPRQSRG